MILVREHSSESKRVLVTGAGGFIGRNLCSQLLQAGHFVRGVIRGELSLDLDGVELVGAEISPTLEWGPIVDGVDCVVHAAGRAHVLKECSNDPLAAFRYINVEASLHLARHCIDAGVKRFFFLSSIGVHGAWSERSGFTEEDPPRPMNSYALSKYEAEQRLTELVVGSSMELVIVRPPLVYGPNAPGNFGRLLWALNKGLPLPFGGLDVKRSFASLNNLVDFLVTSLFHPAAANEVFLVSDGHDVTLPDFIRRLSAAMGHRPILVPVPCKFLKLLASLPRYAGLSNICQPLCADISKARTVLGWAPPYTLDQGLKFSVEGH